MIDDGEVLSEQRMLSNFYKTDALGPVGVEHFLEQVIDFIGAVLHNFLLRFLDLLSVVEWNSLLNQLLSLLLDLRVRVNACVIACLRNGNSMLSMK